MKAKMMKKPAFAGKHPMPMKAGKMAHKPGMKEPSAKGKKSRVQQAEDDMDALGDTTF